MRGLTTAGFRPTRNGATDAFALVERGADALRQKFHHRNSPVRVPDRTDAILESIGDGVYATDETGTIVLWNAAAARLTGRKAGAALGSGCAAVMGLSVGGLPVDCSRGCPFLDRSNGDNQSCSLEVVRDRPGGRQQPLLLTVARTSADERNGEVVHSFRDITALKQAEEAQTMFLATASHELKTPLTVILGFAQAVRMGGASAEEVDEALEKIETRAQELSRIVDRLLMTGRIQSGRIALTFEAVDLNETLTERVTSFASASGRDIALSLDPGVPKILSAPEALKIVIDHLLENAVKYSPEGGRVEVRSRRAGTVVEFDVVDHGVGMQDDEQTHCFDRFWQAESSDVRRFGGTGVGLYIVRTLVEAMDGSIRVRSSLGEGSTFTVMLRPHTDSDASRDNGSLQPRVSERSIVKEGMRQIGIPHPGGAI